jgi:hypothetical protein
MPGTPAAELPLSPFGLRNHKERAMTTTILPDSKWLHAVAAAAFLAAFAPQTAPMAQGLQDPKAIDTIVGTEVHEEQTPAAAQTDAVIKAIDKTAENIATVRKATTLDAVNIVFLPDAAVTEGGPPDEIAAKVEEHKDEIGELRQELEGNAMLYHAIDSRQILIRDILAVEFKDAGVVIYAAAKPAGG